MMNVTRINALRRLRLPGQHMYEWSTSFEAIHRALKLAGYAWKEGDDEELYKTISAAQLTQNEINLLHGRGFQLMNTGEFDQMALETLLVKEREVFGTYHEDKRVKDAKALVKKAYESHPTFQHRPSACRKAIMAKPNRRLGMGIPTKEAQTQRASVRS